MNSTISIVTVTLNEESVLPRLISSLRAQTDKNFDWVVVDGASTDGTRELIASTDLISKWISQTDSGIYDAMNKAINMVTTEYYLVVGADDWLYPNAVERYRFYSNKSGGDIITGGIMRNGKLDQGKHRYPWLYAHHAYVSEHSVGTLIRKSLHDKFGFYSQRFPIGADLLFLKKACSNAETKVLKADFVAGVFSQDGVSRRDRVAAICDYFRAQLETEKYKYLQIILFVAKLLLNARAIVRACQKIK